jgi:hypothetical protein
MSRSQTVLAIPCVKTASLAPAGELVLANTRWEVKRQASNPEIIELFDSSSSHPMEASEKAALAEHQEILFIVGQIQHPKDAVLLATYVAEVLVDQGTGVYVESAGVAHSASFWQRLAAEAEVNSVAELFVGFFMNEEEFLGTFGMEQFGLADVSIKVGEDPDVERELLLTVCLDGIENAEVLRKNGRIKHEDDGQVYRLSPAESVLGESNSNGCLRLIRSF